MIPKLYLLYIIGTLIIPALTQFGGVRPDVRFDEQNERFDLTGMFQDNNRMFYPRQMANDEDKDFRRRSETKKGESPIRRADDSFAYHDRMDSNEGGSVLEYEQNLKHFMNADNFKNYNRGGRRVAELVDYLHGGKGKYRRCGTEGDEKEVLMHHAVPVIMNIDGYLKVPTE